MTDLDSNTINTAHALFVSLVRDFQRLELIKALQESNGPGAETAIAQAAAALGLINRQAKPSREIPPPTLRSSVRRCRERKASIRRMVAAAEKAGKTVTSVTLPDGTVLQFGEPAPAPAGINSWTPAIVDLEAKLKGRH